MKKPLRKIGKWLHGVTKNERVRALVVQFLTSRYMTK